MTTPPPPNPQPPASGPQDCHHVPPNYPTDGLTILPVLAAQLEWAAQEMESQILKVCTSFQSIAVRARQCAEHSLRLCDTKDTPGNTSAGISAILAAARSFAERIEQFSRISAQIHSICAQMEAAQKVLQSIDDIAAQIRLLGFNASIEAVHAGDHGATFQVVATETRELAQHVAETSRSLRRTVLGLKEKTEEIESKVQSASAIAAEIKHIYDAMQAVYEEMRAAALDSANASAQLAQQTGEAVTALQFQDRVKQQITHVIEALREMHRAVATCPAEAAGAVPATAPTWDTRLRAKYTMREERMVHASQDMAGPRETAARPGSIELF